MTGRESLLAGIEARRRKQAEESVELLKTDLSFTAEDAGYDPYDNPGTAKPLDIDGRRPKKRRPLKRRR